MARTGSAPGNGLAANQVQPIGALENKYHCTGTGIVRIDEFQSGTVRT
jgi:hypothetical protein